MSLFDEVMIEPATQYRCEIIGANIQDNIVDKVISLLKNCLNQDILLNVTIKKNIPIAAGLGGGSSNAAVVLQLLLSHFQVPDPLKNDIYCKAKALGADISFFLQSNNAFVEGIGDVVKPVVLHETYYILLVNPGLEVSAKDAYKSCSEEDFSEKIVCDNQNIKNEILTLKNGLERGVRKEHSEINDLLTIIKKQNNCLVSRMSGSGATCFGLFCTMDDLYEAEQQLKKIFPNYWFYSERVLL
jgi:4-diphosphocytidyl-2-C-methyl-D-erythritol kinase